MIREEIWKRTDYLQSAMDNEIFLASCYISKDGYYEIAVNDMFLHRHLSIEERKQLVGRVCEKLRNDGWWAEAKNGIFAVAGTESIYTAQKRGCERRECEKSQHIVLGVAVAVVLLTLITLFG